MSAHQSLKVVCIGEMLAQLVTDPDNSTDSKLHLNLYPAGAESNVAVNLAQLGTDSYWLGGLGADTLGNFVAQALHTHGVNIDLIAWRPGLHTAIMVKTTSTHGRKVDYVRKGSAGSFLTEAEIDKALAINPQWVHVSGINLCLSDDYRNAMFYLKNRAHRLKIPVSFDVNYRPQLWAGSSPEEVILEFADGLHTVFIGRDEAASIWGGSANYEIHQTFKTCDTVVIKDNGGKAYSCHEQTWVEALPQQVNVVDIVGAGDAFAAGWIHGTLMGLPHEMRLRLGHHVAGLAITTDRDFGIFQLDDSMISTIVSDESWLIQGV